MNKVKSFAELDPSVFNFEHSGSLPEKPSQKALDVFVRKLLELHPELSNVIKSALQLLLRQHSELPIVHITSSKIKKDGKTETTGFVENIKTGGFKARHTNVGVFVERGKNIRRAGPQYFIDHPEEFVKSFYLLLQRYGHHGSRTNKQVLGDNMGSEGVPEMIIIDGNLELEKGSDYDDHYILSKGADPKKIIGEMDLEFYKPYPEHLNEILQEFLSKLSDRYARLDRAA